MASTNAETSDRNRIHLMSRPLDFLDRILKAAGMFGTFSMLALVTLDIFGRVLFNSPLPGVPEFVRLLIVCIVFLQLPDALKSGAFIRSRTIPFGPRSTAVLELCYNLIGACVLAAICAFSYQPALYAWISNEANASGFGDIPVFPVRFIILVGSCFTCLRFIAMATKKGG
jgi:TRAP-type C4-dicarboxylate transport system permease small subunit